jgi:hypothetical protein
MELVVSDSAVDLIRERGGRLYVWVKRSRCCGAPATVSTAAEPPRGVGEFRQIEGCESFELFVPKHLARLPHELHVDVRRWPRRVEAYWDGCAWVT